MVVYVNLRWIFIANWFGTSDVPSVRNRSHLKTETGLRVGVGLPLVIAPVLRQGHVHGQSLAWVKCKAGLQRCHAVCCHGG